MNGFLLVRVSDPWTTLLTKLSGNGSNDYNCEGYFWQEGSKRYCQLYDKIIGRMVIWTTERYNWDDLFKSPFTREIKTIPESLSVPELSSHFRTVELHASLQDLIKNYLNNHHTYLIETVDITTISTEQKFLQLPENPPEYLKQCRRLLFSLHEESYTLFSIVWNLYLTDPNANRLLDLFDYFHKVIGKPQPVNFLDGTAEELKLVLTFCSRLGDGYRSLCNNILSSLEQKEN